MNSYKIIYYNSGGYKTSYLITTDNVIDKDENNELQMLDCGKIVGGAEEIESMLLEQLGYIESVMVVDAQSVTD